MNLVKAASRFPIWFKESIRVIGITEIILVAERYTKKGLIGPLFSTGLYFLLFNGLLTLLLNWIEKRMDYFRA